jgi:hypothetical protein
MNHLIYGSQDDTKKNNDDSNPNEKDIIELDFSNLEMNHLEGDIQVDQIDNVRENLLTKLINEDTVKDFLNKENVIAYNESGIRPPSQSVPVNGSSDMKDVDDDPTINKAFLIKDTFMVSRLTRLFPHLFYNSACD